MEDRLTEMMLEAFGEGVRVVTKTYDAGGKFGVAVIWPNGYRNAFMAGDNPPDWAVVEKSAREFIERHTAAG